MNVPKTWRAIYWDNWYKNSKILPVFSIFTDWPGQSRKSLPSICFWPKDTQICSVHISFTSIFLPCIIWKAFSQEKLLKNPLLSKKKIIITAVIASAYGIYQEYTSKGYVNWANFSDFRPEADGGQTFSRLPRPIIKNR